jgi:hypothetical protein
MTSQEEREIDEGNILLSKYLYGESKVNNYYQIGYKDTNIIYRHEKELHNDFYINFHNNWECLMDVIAKIAKDSVDNFSTEERLIDELKNNMFQFSYSIFQSWQTCVKYVKLKMII